MGEDAADALREAVDGARTVSDAWEDQQSVNESITVSSTELVDSLLTDDSRTDELDDVITEVAESKTEKSDV